MKQLFVLLIIATLGISSTFAQNDNGMNKDKGKHTGQMKYHRHRGQIQRLKSSSIRANRKVTHPKPKQYLIL
jgi:hypothetical protein